MERFHLRIIPQGLNGGPLNEMATGREWRNGTRNAI